MTVSHEMVVNTRSGRLEPISKAVHSVKHDKFKNRIHGKRFIAFVLSIICVVAVCVAVVVGPLFRENNVDSHIMASQDLDDFSKASQSIRSNCDMFSPRRDQDETPNQDGKGTGTGKSCECQDMAMDSESPPTLLEFNYLLKTFVAMLSMLSLGLGMMLNVSRRGKAQMKKYLDDTNFKLEMAQHSMSILESELQRKMTQQGKVTRLSACSTVKLLDEPKILAHYDTTEDAVQNYLNDTGAMLIQEDQVSCWVECEKKYAIVMDGLGELKTLLSNTNVANSRSKREALKEALFIVEQLTLGQ